MNTGIVPSVTCTAYVRWCVLINGGFTCPQVEWCVNADSERVLVADREHILI